MAWRWRRSRSAARPLSRDFSEGSTVEALGRIECRSERSGKRFQQVWQRNYKAIVLRRNVWPELYGVGKGFFSRMIHVALNISRTHTQTHTHTYICASSSRQCRHSRREQAHTTNRKVLDACHHKRCCMLPTRSVECNTLVRNANEDTTNH